MKEIKINLLCFLKDYLDWAQSEKPDNRYNKMGGLCAALSDFSQENKIDYEVYLDTTYLLADYFKQDNLCHQYPFGEIEYMLHYKTASQHKDLKRLNWVRKTISDLEEELKGF